MEIDEIRTKLKQDLIKKYGSIEKAAKETGVPRSTLGGYVRGETTSMNKANIKRLYDATGLEYLSELLQLSEKVRGKKEKINQLELQLRNAQTSFENIGRLLTDSRLSEEVRAIARENLILSDEKRARRAADLLYAFLEEAKGVAPSDDARKKFTKLFSEKDAGYLLSLVNYLYNPDKFKKWIGESAYQLRK